MKIFYVLYNEEYKDSFSIKTYQATSDTGTTTVRMMNRAMVNNWVPNEVYDEFKKFKEGDEFKKFISKINPED